MKKIVTKAYYGQVPVEKLIEFMLIILVQNALETNQHSLNIIVFIQLHCMVVIETNHKKVRMKPINI